jgi:hypothetical protein
LPGAAEGGRNAGKFRQLACTWLRAILDQKPPPGTLAAKSNGGLSTRARNACAISPADVYGVERVACGGHYVSDVAFGALINWFLVLAAAMLMRIRPPG